ncbi:MAG: hypothetical protein AWM53_01011 [Candidatus Dichloromethanomonas elyunquensis]|nr:MAG: hypothetical protein AWM53_01011 [Candidatus Dichloromethanomonas elyunquensis]
MIEFKEVEVADKKWMDPFLAASDMSGCHHNFTNIFAWADNYHNRIARVNNYLLVKGVSELGPYYFYPSGWGDIAEIFQLLKKDAADCGHDFVLAGISHENIDNMDTLFPGCFRYEEMRDSFDYVYSLEKLAELSGRKYQAKRNHINRFRENYPDWRFEPISSQNIEECREMNREWCIVHKCNDDDLLKKEKCAVKRCFDHYFELGLEGGLLRVNNKVAAYTMGEKLNSNTYVTHIEKAFNDMQGAYQMINRQFAALVQEKHPEIVYINREEDMGLEGLRKAKLSYHPVKMEEKYLATYTGNAE